MRPVRVLVAKPGLDGHDRGALIVAQGLRDAGMEVIYTGLRQTVDQIVATALDEDVDCIGLSSLSGAHMALFPAVTAALRARGASDILVVGGGVIPSEDIAALKEEGIAAVFTPGSSISEMADFIRAHVSTRSVRFAAEPEMPEAIDHIGIAVHRLTDGYALYCEQLGMRLIEEEDVPSAGVRVAFLDAGNTHLELLEPLGERSPIAAFLEKRGPGIHHIAYRVDDVDNWLVRMKTAGYPLLDEKKRPGAGNKWVGFVHPKKALGVLMEFCESRTEV
ncbi:methylmalonyl-CoA epimerase [Ferroacidibacillus organovorans]|uniref:Methylmalonyl-CoA epimerase n=1 Tax=Ferroacidibacillus organovorans TaxID=1765683 RepID=A0A101XQX1_9BACL|nr:methylmalonyl-CoA epimerase [Ferroacidibacillus organovorans]KUO95893.1 methylmalonyl-CoA epimerase [Ferroacidibacillus organovorans]